MTPLERARVALAKMERDAERQWQAAGQRGVETSVTNFLTESQARAKTDRLRAEGFTVNEPRNLPYDKAGEMKVIRVVIAEADRLAVENADIRAQLDRENAGIVVQRPYEPLPDPCNFVSLDGVRCDETCLVGGFCGPHDEEIYALGGDSSEGGRAIIKRSALPKSTAEALPEVPDAG